MAQHFEEKHIVSLARIWPGHSLPKVVPSSVEILKKLSANGPQGTVPGNGYMY